MNFQIVKDDVTLQNRMDNMTLKHVTYKGIQLAYTEVGQGDTIILLHGFLEDHSMWNHIIPTLARLNHVVAIDLLGHGDTKCLGDVHTMDDMADAVFAIIDQLNLSNVTLIGHSMGGYVSLALAENYPQYISKIILIASSSKPDSLIRQQNRDRAIALVDKNRTLFITMAIHNLFQAKNREILEDEINNNIQIALKTPVQGIKAALIGMKIRPDRESILFFADFPIYAILGIQDTIMPFKETVSQFETANYTALQGGHMLHIETKNDLLEAILSYITKN